ncbi:stage II sporulation protein E [Calderihabitans maritimus]|uniref:Stage II sporulation protein E n=1 Tax=Calderihabitans maritimus TaxID=1246530 RepID=A0A1Z5HS20_9FIRM|nr:stage II sporulation protein E [Calderihabitans maritimus]GAW92228.1 stage II sporulation protein E [Calderihabitans maritimus]
MKEDIEVYPYRRIYQSKHQGKSRQNGRGASRITGQAMLKIFTWGNIALQLLGFLFGRSLVMGELLPFGPAFYAGVVSTTGTNPWLLLISVCFGIFTIRKGMEFWGSVAVLLIIALLHRFYQLDAQRRGWLLPSVSVGSVVMLARGVLAALYEPTLYKAVAISLEGFLAVGLTAAFIVVAKAVKKSKGLIRLNTEEIICFAIFGIGIVGGVGNLTVGKLSLQSLVSGFVILLSALVGGPGLGASVGTVMGMIPGLSMVNAPFLVGKYAFSGFLAGIFKSYEKLGVAVGFMLGELLLAGYLTDRGAVIANLSESALAAMLMFLIPKGVINHLAGLVFPDREEEEKAFRSYRRRSNLVVRKAKELSRIFTELSRAFSEVTVYRRETQQNLDALLNYVSKRVCARCGVLERCWGKEFYGTYQNIMGIFNLVEIRGLVLPEEISPDIKKKCLHIPELVTAVNCAYEHYKTDKAWQERWKEIHRLVSNQMEGVAAIFTHLSQGMETFLNGEEEWKKALQEALKDKKIDFGRLEIERGSNQNLEIFLTKVNCPYPTVDCKEIITGRLKPVFNQGFIVDKDYCGLEKGDPKCKLTVHLDPVYTVKVGYAQLPKEEGKISGDCYASLRLPIGRHVLILSDGMGTGAPAARESYTAVSFLKQLLSVGFSPQIAVQTVNSLLLTRSQEETFATIDLASINLFTGETDFIKIGAAPCFIRRNSDVEMIAASSLPVGIFNRVEVSTVTKHLKPGDLLVMVSDGVLEMEGGLDVEWFMDLLRSLTDKKVELIANRILERICAVGGKFPLDDLSILVARLERLSG